MQWNEVPNRRLGLLAGIIGGIGGMVALHYYRDHLEARLLPQSSDQTEVTLAEVTQTHVLDSMSLIGTRYLPGESAPETVARLGYEWATDESPALEVRYQLADLILWVAGVAAGGAYGGTRTTTAPRDLAGGFFYGIRLWLGDTFGLALLGLQPSPMRLSPADHVRRLLRFWVFSFVSTAITRLLYVLIA